MAVVFKINWILRLCYWEVDEVIPDLTAPMWNAIDGVVSLYELSVHKGQQEKEN